MVHISSSCQFPVDPSLITVGTVCVPQSSTISMFFGISHPVATMCTFVADPVMGRQCGLIHRQNIAPASFLTLSFGCHLTLP